MTETPVTLLERLRREPSGPAWQRLTDLYAPLLRRWLGRYRLQPSDVDDVVQEVLSALARHLPGFKHGGHGAFRAWLRGILTNLLRAFWRKRRDPPLAGEAAERLLAELEDPNSDLSRRWEE